VVAFLLASFRPNGPYPGLGLAGEQGSAKSTLSKLVRALVDPNVAPLRALPRDDRDLFIAANNAHLLIFDNVSGLPTWLSDTLCRLMTGGGFSTRQLFTDDSETLFDGKRPVVLNGIKDVAIRPDLVDRMLMLLLDMIDESKRKTEKELWAAFERDRPAILGALLDAVVHGLARIGQVKLTRVPRMADFYEWITACETAFWLEGTFRTAYEANIATAVHTAIDADLVATAVKALMNGRTSWDGPATQLPTALGSLVTKAQRRSKEWPKAPNHLSGQLREVAPPLRKVGIEIDRDREGKGGNKLIHIRLAEEKEQRSSTSSASSAGSRVKDLGLTLTEGGASAPASAEPDADAKADANNDTSVSLNSLNKQVTDDADDADDQFSALSESQEHRCAQCNGDPDGTECEFLIEGDRVWLHEQCERFYLRNRA